MGGGGPNLQVQKCQILSFSDDLLRSGARGCGRCDAPLQICQKVHFQPQNGSKLGFCRFKWLRYKKVHFLGPKGQLLRGPGPPPPKLILATDLDLLQDNHLALQKRVLKILKWSAKHAH